MNHPSSTLFTACLLTLLACSACEPPNHPAGLKSIFGETGMGPGEFSYPRAAVLTPQNQLYIVDKAARIQAYDLQSNFILEWRMPQRDAGKPTGLGTDSNGNIYAADTHYARVIIFDSAGNPLGKFGAPGDGPGQFRMPTDVAIDSLGFIYVSEYGGNDRISKFTPNCEFVLSFGGSDSGPAQLRRPQSLYCDADNSLWVADACNHRICHFSPTGELLTTFGQSGSRPGELRFPYGLDCLSDNTFVVCEYGNNRIQRFDRQGRSLGTWGTPGRKPGQLAYPWAVVVAPTDRIFVIDSGNNRVQVIDARNSNIWRPPTAAVKSTQRYAACSR